MTEGLLFAADLAEDEYIAVYGYGINRISRFTDGTTGEIYLFNAHGDVVGLVAISGENVGKTIKEYDYDAFGNEVFPDPDDANPFRYCGEYYDKGTNRLYLRARDYDSATGRFTQQDGWGYGNIANPLSLNLYTYCHNDPVGYIDPSGHVVTEWDREHLTEEEIKYLEHISECWKYANQENREKYRAEAEAIRAKYRMSYEYTDSHGYTQINKEDLLEFEKKQKRIMEIIPNMQLLPVLLLLLVKLIPRCQE